MWWILDGASGNATIGPWADPLEMSINTTITLSIVTRLHTYSISDRVNLKTDTSVGTLEYKTE